MATITSFATPADLQAWTGEDAPANAGPMLRSATILVAAECRLSPYANYTDSTGDVLRDATCVQAAYWAASDLTPGQIADSVVKRVEQLTGVVEYDTSGRATQVAAGIEGLCPEACALLVANNLIYVPKIGIDECAGVLPSYGLPSQPYSTRWPNYRWPPLTEAEWPADWPWIP